MVGVRSACKNRDVGMIGVMFEPVAALVRELSSAWFTTGELLQVTVNVGEESKSTVSRG